MIGSLQSVPLLNFMADLISDDWSIPPVPLLCFRFLVLGIAQFTMLGIEAERELICTVEIGRLASRIKF